MITILSFNLQVCFVLEPTVADMEGEGRPSAITWSLEQSVGDICSNEKTPVVNSFLCETAPTLTLPAECQEQQHKCRDGMCIMAYDVCDGHKDCLDGDDELNCGDVCKPNGKAYLIVSLECHVVLVAM